MKRPASLADAYSRYAALIAAQLEALDNGDDGAFEQFSRERDALALAIDQIRANEPPQQQLEQLRELVRNCVMADRRLRARLEQLRDEHLGHARQIRANRAALRSYTPAAHAGSQLDLTL